MTSFSNLIKNNAETLGSLTSGFPIAGKNLVYMNSFSIFIGDDTEILGSWISTFGNEVKVYEFRLTFWLETLQKSWNPGFPDFELWLRTWCL